MKKINFHFIFLSKSTFFITFAHPKSQNLKHQYLMNESKVLKYIEDFMANVEARNPHEPEFFQAVHEVVESLAPFILENPVLMKNKVLERMTEPERIISFRVPWIDDQGDVQVCICQGACTERPGFIGQGAVQGIAFIVSINSYRCYAHLPGGSHDPCCYLTPVGYEYFIHLFQGACV